MACVVQRKSLALQHVPEALLTEELCMTAVRQNGEALEYVPAVLLEQVKQAEKKYCVPAANLSCSY
jgi:hypothetical protein